MANPVAAHTFDFVYIYLSTRTGGAPGSGIWTNPVVLFNGNTDPTNFFDATTFSAGSLLSTDPYGILSQTDGNVNTGLSFLGNGAPSAPQLLTFPGQQSSKTPGSGYWNTSQGAWNFGGKFYAIVANNVAGNYVVTILQSTTGNSPWIVMDGSHGPTALLASDGRRAAVQQIDNYIYVITPTSNVFASTTFQIFPFNLVTGLWETASTVLTIANFNGFGIGGIGPSPFTNGLIKFVNGNFLVFYNVGSSSPLTPVFRLLSGGLSGIWGSEITLPGQEFANCVIDPSLNPVHVFTYNGTTAPNSAVFYSAVDNMGTLVSTIATIPACVGSAGDGVGHCSIQNGMIFVPRDDTADFDNSVWVGALPAPATFFKETLPIPPGETNTISGASPNGSGSGYVVGDTGTVNGGVAGYSAQYTIDGVGNNSISTYSYGTPNLGTGYVPGDTGTISGGSHLARYQVLTVGGGGAVNTLVLTDLGTNYSTGLKATSAITGSGTGLQIDVLTVFNGVYGLTISPGGGGYSVANNVGTTTGGAQPGIGTGLTINITAVSGKIPSCAYMMFPNGYSLTASIAIACPIAPLTATMGVMYISDPPIVSGDTPPDTFSLVSGPPWMTINPLTGVVSGIPSASGAVTYVIKVTDSLGNAATVSSPCGLTVSGGPDMCILPPATGQENLVLINEPLENQGT